MPPGSTADYGDSIIVPSYLKDPQRLPVLESIWHAAREALANAESVTVIGYSLPHADAFANQLFTTMDRCNTTLESVTLVLDGDDEAFWRWDTLLAQHRSTLKRVRKTFEEFVTSPIWLPAS